MKNRSNRTQGFTLVELVVATLIIGLLAAVLIPNALGARARANNSAVQTFLKNLAQEMETVYADNGRYFPEGTEADGFYPGDEIYFGVQTFVEEFLSDDATPAASWSDTFEIALPANISLVFKTNNPDPYSGYCVVARWNSRDVNNYNTYILTPAAGVQLVEPDLENDERGADLCPSFGAAADTNPGG